MEREVVAAFVRAQDAIALADDKVVDAYVGVGALAG
jgi:hypothetical protein